MTVPNVMINAEMCDAEEDNEEKQEEEERGEEAGGEEAGRGATEDLNTSVLDIQRCKFCAGDWSTMADFMKCRWGITQPW